MRRRELKDLNLIDDFLFWSAVVRGEEGEQLCRIILETVLGRKLGKIEVIAQKNIPGVNPKRHGIMLDAYITAERSDAKDKHDRLKDSSSELVEIQKDIYDIEPNTYKIGFEARRGRFYHSLIDTRMLKSGVKYNRLKNVVVIMIQPYDLFGKNRLMYTFATKCEEDPTIEYDDGIKTIYLYTKGKEGNYSQELRDMLKFIEESRPENAANDDLKKMQKLIDEVKQDDEVGVQYMKSWEVMEYMEEEARAEGHARGLEEGRVEGLAKGRVEGLAQGCVRGHAEGRKEAIISAIEAFAELGVPRDTIKGKLIDKFGMTEAEADGYLQGVL